MRAKTSTNEKKKRKTAKRAVEQGWVREEKGVFPSRNRVKAGMIYLENVMQVMKARMGAEKRWRRDG